MTTCNARSMAELARIECRDATNHHQQPPLVFQRAEGSWVYDVDGRCYLDLCAGFGVLALGHNHPRIQQVLASCQIMHGMGDVYPSSDKVAYLRAVIESLPPHLSKGAFALSGSQAVEYALKTALLFTGKQGVLCFSEGYHGLDFGALAITPRPQFQEPFASWLVPHVQAAAFGCSREELRTVLRSLDTRANGVAAIIVEPVQGRAGVVLPPPAWLDVLREEADRWGCLLIFDDVFAGWGRCGLWTAAAEVPADLVCLGKALGGGMPLSACVGREDVFAAWPQSQGEALHTGTFFGHPLSCRIGLEAFQVMKEEQLLERAVTVGSWWRSDLQQRLQNYPLAKEVRGRGLMIGIECRPPGAGVRLADVLREAGVIALPAGAQGQVLSLSPALNIAEELLAQASESIVKAFENIS